MTNDDRTTFLEAVKAAYRQDLAVHDCAVKRPTQLHVAIAHVLAHWCSSAHPSHKQLAFAARASVRTVRHALSAFRALGLLDWTHRIVSLEGWRAQISNVYRVGSQAVDKVKSVALHLQ